MWSFKELKAELDSAEEYNLFLTAAPWGETGEGRRIHRLAGAEKKSPLLVAQAWADEREEIIKLFLDAVFEGGEARLQAVGTFVPTCVNDEGVKRPTASLID